MRAALSARAGLPSPPGGRTRLRTRPGSRGGGKTRTLQRRRSSCGRCLEPLRVVGGTGAQSATVSCGHRAVAARICALISGQGAWLSGASARRHAARPCSERLHDRVQTRRHSPRRNRCSRRRRQPAARARGRASRSCRARSAAPLHPMDSRERRASCTARPRAGSPGRGRVSRARASRVEGAPDRVGDHRHPRRRPSCLARTGAPVGRSRQDESGEPCSDDPQAA